MRRTDSLERALMLGQIEGGRRRGWQRMRWLMASPTRWTWVWVSSRSWWWTGKPAVLQSMGSQRIIHDWVTELNWRRKLQGRRQDSNCGQMCSSSERGKSGWWAWIRLKKLKCDHVQKGRVAAVSVMRGNQQELSRQKNKKRQSSLVKGKHWAAGAIVPQAEGHADHAAEAEKGKREGGSQVALGLRMQPSCPWPVHLKPVPPRWGFLPQGSRGQDRWRSLCPESATGPFCASFPSGSLSPFSATPRGWGGYPFLVFSIPVGFTPKF